MRSIGTLCRRGTSTILGTLIFVGIMFTAVIPMFLVMNQADTFFEMRKHELKLFDEERGDEDLQVYVFPAGESSEILTLRVLNRGDFVVKIVKIWINDISYSEEDFIVEPMGVDEKILDGYFTPVIDEYYFIKVTTDRGNIFSSGSGSIQYLGGSTWEGGIFMINVVISCTDSGWFDIVILHDTTTVHTDEIQKSSSRPAFAFYDVDVTGIYDVTITKRNLDVIYDKQVEINWPLGPPVAWVFA